MSVTPFAEQERELLIELAYLFAHRAERERVLAARLAEGMEAATARHRAAVQRARAEHGTALAAAEQEHRAAREQAEKRLAAAVGALTGQMEAELGAYREKTRGIGRAIEARRRETEWLAEAMVESGQGRILPVFEATRKSIAQRLGELDALEREAAAELARGRFAPLPEEGAAPAEPGESTPADLEAAIKGVQEVEARFHAAVNPGMLAPLTVVTVVLATALAGAMIAARVGAGPDVWTIVARSWPWALRGAGIGGGAALVVVLALRLIMRRRVPRAAAQLRDALTAARRAAAGALRGAERARDTKIAGLNEVTEKERETARTTVAALTAELERRTSTGEPELRARHDAALARARSIGEKEIATIDARLAARKTALDEALAAATGRADAELEPARHTLEESVGGEMAALVAEWDTRLGAALATARALAEEGERSSPPWDRAGWESFEAVRDTVRGVRFGRLRVDLARLPGGLSEDARFAVPGPTELELPLMVDLMGKGSVLLRAGPDQREAGIAALNDIVLRLLTGLPPGKARFTFVDPVGLGQSFAGLMHVSDYEEAIVGERIWTDPRHIEQRLIDLTEHMETVIQKYLRNEYETIQAYNEEAGEVAEPYRFLVIADLPTTLSETSAKKLASIAASGARCGVFTLVLTTQAGGRAPGVEPAPLSDLERHGMVLHLRPPGAVWAREPFTPWPVSLESPPGEAETTRLLHRVGEHVRDSTRVRVPFSIVEPPEDRLWSGDASAEVRLPLGRAGAKKLQYLTLGRGTAQHALIAGRTGSGKSTLLHVIATTAALWYSPEEIELYLVDFKKGVEFKTYAARRLPHARVVAVESEREFGLSVLRRLDAELTRRGSLFREAGVQDLASYRRWIKGREPGPARVMLVVDEFQEFFVEDDRLAQDAALLLDRLVRQGRAFGVHVVLGSQTLGGAYSLARSTLGQMAVRIALQCSESDSYLIMSEDNPAPRLLSRPGEAIYNDASGLIEGNSPFQVVWLPDEVRDERLDMVRERGEARRGVPPAPIVFEGNVPADAPSNRPLADLLARRGPRRAAPELWLGEPLAIKEPTGVVLRQQSAANVLIVGNNEEQAAAMAAVAAVSLAAWVRAGDGSGSGAAERTTVTILDSTLPDAGHAGLLRAVAESLGPSARHAGAREARAVLASLRSEIEAREASESASHPPMLLVIHGLQRFRELRRSDDFSFSSDADQAATPAAMLTRVLRDGPSVGVHVLVWCDTATNVDRMLERSALREFNSRVLMQMSAGDSTQLIEGPHASALGAHRALLYSDDSGTSEKFRPYAAPPTEWVASAAGLGDGEPDAAGAAPAP